MKKIIVLIAGVAMCAALLAGCGAKKEEETEAAVENDAAVVGTWMENDFDSGYVFNSDGTGKDIYWDKTFIYTAHDGTIVITYDDKTYAEDKYSYSITDDGRLSMARSTGDKSFLYTKK